METNSTTPPNIQPAKILKIKVNTPTILIASLIVGLLLLSTTLLLKRNSPSQKKITEFTPIPTSTLTPNSQTQPNSEESLRKSLIKLTSKEYKNTTISAYQVSVYLPQTVIIINDNDSLFDTITTTKSAAGFATDKLFDISNDQLLVTNSKTNSLFIYKIQEGDGQPEPFKYIDTIPLPKYDMGQLYSIECKNNNECTIKTAIHLEAGCNLTLNLETKRFSTPLCFGGSSKSYTPNPL